MSTQLCWFRSDLRVRDNPALANALALGLTRAIYIATPAQWQTHDDAPIKLDFWRRNLRMLEGELGKLNVELLYFQVKDFKELTNLFQTLLPALEASHLHYNREYPVNEMRRDEQVDSICTQSGVEVSSYDDQLLASPSSLLNQSGSAFKVFTPFAKKALGVIQSNARIYNGPPPLNGNASSLPQVQILPEQVDIADIDWPKPQLDWERAWPAGENHARKRLRDFTQHRISTYKVERDIPSCDSTSRLSPYLSGGIISVAECWRSIHGHSESIGMETWRNELLWREFYRHILVHFPHVCMHKAYRENMNHVPWRHDEKEFDKWCHGQTGYPLVDAGMRQLLETGWMHNRLRMVTAMFLSKHLLIDWRWGERWFMRNLIDGDLASNNGGWQWSASTGVDAAPYFRIFSPLRQSQRFDAQAQFIRHYVPELADLPNKLIHDPAKAEPADYPQPIVEHRFARERALNAFKGQ